MTLTAVPIVDYRVVEPEFMKPRELEALLKDFGAKGFEVAALVPRSPEGSARLILARRVATRMPGETN